MGFEENYDRTVRYRDDTVVSEPGRVEEDGSIVEAIRRRFPLL